MSDAAPTAPPSDALPQRPSAGRPRAQPKRSPGLAGGPPVTRPAPRAKGRWTDTLTGLLLCVAAGGVIIAAAPALLRAAGLAGPSRDEPELRTGGRLALPQPPVGGPGHPIFSHGEDDEDDDRPGPLFADPRTEGRHSGAMESDPHPTPEPRASASGKRAQAGVARRTLELFEHPGQGGIVLGEVHKGDLVMIGKEVGDWVLVAHDGTDGVVMGWTKKSEIAVR